MIDLPTAVQTAKQNLLKLFSSENIDDLLLEEVDFDKQWMITVSFVRVQFESASNPMFRLGEGRRPIRVFKTVHLNAESGELMKIVDRPSRIAA